MSDTHSLSNNNGPVHPTYNSYFSIYFSVKTVFFSHNKSTNSVFHSDYQHSRTGQCFDLRYVIHFSWVLGPLSNEFQE
jgi:hypothetical protein